MNYKQKAEYYKVKSNYMLVLNDIENLRVIRYLNIYKVVRKEWSFWRDYYKTPYERMNWLLENDNPMYK